MDVKLVLTLALQFRIFCSGVVIDIQGLQRRQRRKKREKDKMKTQRDHYVDSLTLKDFLSTNFKARVWTTDLQLNICVFYLLFNVLK